MSRYQHFGLVLMVNHACNLRCDYCYTGAKFSRRMSRSIAEKAIDRALDSLETGGTLELGFFGGERSNPDGFDGTWHG
jgi:sulfatase maturation enzyme AslB (radical SAM superfamily)